MCYGSYLILQNGKVHIPAGILALKRAQRGDVVAARAAKDAQAAANAAKEANAKAADSRDNATEKKHPKASKCPELRGDISYIDGWAEARLLQGMQTELLLRGMGRSLRKTPPPAFQSEW